jgi:hypothetical protein
MLSSRLPDENVCFSETLPRGTLVADPDPFDLFPDPNFHFDAAPDPDLIV